MSCYELQNLNHLNNQVTYLTNLSQANKKICIYWANYSQDTWI